MASDGSASSSIDVLLASMCACMAHYLGDYLHDRSIGFSGYAISAESKLTEDRTRLAEIRVKIEVQASTITESQKKDAAVFLKQCQIHNTLKANSPIFIDVL